MASINAVDNGHVSSKKDQATYFGVLSKNQEGFGRHAPKLPVE